jgi:tRNA threonylcarbamoyladenosine biosynthesis protein TsaE
MIRSEKEIGKAARQIIDFSDNLKNWLFYGEMGAGKTTLITAICREYKIVDLVNSPSFAIINEYQDEQGKSFFHFDFYRLKQETEAMTLGLEEYFYSGSICMIEWPSKIPNLLPETYLKITLEIISDNSRLIIVDKHG